MNSPRRNSPRQTYSPNGTSQMLDIPDDTHDLVDLNVWLANANTAVDQNPEFLNYLDFSRPSSANRPASRPASRLSNLAYNRPTSANLALNRPASRLTGNQRLADAEMDAIYTDVMDMEARKSPRSTTTGYNRAELLANFTGYQAPTPRPPSRLPSTSSKAPVDDNVRCKKCNILFTNKDLFEKHMIEAHKFPCLKCGNSLKSSESLRSHLKAHTNPYSRIERRTDYGVYAVGGSSGVEVRYACPVCQKEFFGTRGLREHMDSHRIVSADLVCPVCSTTMYTWGAFRAHMMTHVLPTATESGHKSGPKSRPKTVVTPKSVGRPMISTSDELKAFLTKSKEKRRLIAAMPESDEKERLATEHRKYHSRERAVIDRKNPILAARALERKRTELGRKAPTTLKCPECERPFENQHGLNIHIQKMHKHHTPIQVNRKILSTEYKKKRTELKQLPQSDERNRRLDEQFFEHRREWGVLTRRPAHAPRTNKHSTAIDLGERAKKCPKCDNTYDTNSNMNAHLKTAHDTAKVYTCQYCNFLFKSEHQLKVHLKAMHDYKCPKCHYVFASQYVLNEHLKLHKECPVCGQSFVRLEKHIQQVHPNYAPDDVLQRAMRESNIINE